MVIVSASGARAADAPPVDARPALAWRLDAASSAQLGPNQPDAAWKRSAALLEAAGRLIPTEPRFPRLTAMAKLHLDDVDGAIAAVRVYRQLVPADIRAQVQLIDLYTSKMETVDAKVNYLRGLVDKQDLAPEIRAHVASRCATLLHQKSVQEAADMAKRAVALYPLAEAARQYYELLGRGLGVEERAKALMAVLKADPTDAVYLNEMANLLAQEGLADQSLDWYAAAMTVIMRSGPARPEGFHELLMNFASQQIIAGKTSVADSFLSQLLSELPLDADAWFLKLTVMRIAPAQTTNAQIMEMARNALVRRWNGVHDEVLNGPTSQPATAPAQTQDGAGAMKESATTMPAKVDPLDPASVIAKLKDPKNAEGKNAVEVALSDLAWFEIYYANQPAAAKPWIDSLLQMGADETQMARLNGWAALAAGQVQQAREKLSKTAGKDPLARLGLIKADEAEKKPVDEEAARKLLNENRMGLVAVMVWEALRGTKVAPTTQPSAGSITAALGKFPNTWLSLSDQRVARRAYDLRVEPVGSGVSYGDPMLFTVTVRNTSEQDIEINPDALLKPDVWLDASTLGLNQHQFHGVAFDQLGGQIVLPPRASTSQVVRLDVRELRVALMVNVGTSTRVNGNAITNPLVTSEGAFPGPAGVAATFDRTAVQIGLAIGTPPGRKQLDAMLASNSPLDRLHAADILAGLNRVAGMKESSTEVKNLATELNTSLVKLRADSSPAVAAWASYLCATTGPEEQRMGVAGEMAKSGDWTTRLLSLFVGGKADQESAAVLANDGDATVKAAAAATVEMMRSPTTQAASQPTSALGK
jgi:hypothetical protein